ncbi:hypothetical protein LCGC14_2546660 [marine sediment metagenome]|uniref:Glycosyltransferase RgtA/B/C/D-like domain-containing protein n=1 Tax=marine sediment metagenome TaxID=412755 RepID=A0A0F9AP43_9ZZZZ
MALNVADKTSRYTDSSDKPAFSDKAVRRTTLAVVVVICLGYLLALPEVDPIVMIDHHVFNNACEEMRAGSGYYESMDRALRETYGPSESARAFRMPTVFWLWSRLPSQQWAWVVLVVLAGLTGWIFIGVSRTPLAPPLVVIYLLATARFQSSSGSVAQFFLTELWAVPALAASVLAWQKRRRTLAAGFALLAVLIRETAAGIIVGGLISAYLNGERRWPWWTAGLLAAAAYGLHVICVSPYLVAPGEGAETALLGTAEFPMSVLRMAGFGLPAGSILGLVFWVLALRWMWRCEEYSWFPGLLLALPLVGLILDRTYWGVLVVPFTIAWGIDSAVELWSRLKAKKQTSPTN